MVVEPARVSVLESKLEDMSDKIDKLTELVDELRIEAAESRGKARAYALLAGVTGSVPVGLVAWFGGFAGG